MTSDAGACAVLFGAGSWALLFAFFQWLSRGKTMTQGDLETFNALPVYDDAWWLHAVPASGEEHLIGLGGSTVCAGISWCKWTPLERARNGSALARSESGYLFVVSERGGQVYAHAIASPKAETPSDETPVELREEDIHTVPVTPPAVRTSTSAASSLERRQAWDRYAAASLRFANADTAATNADRLLTLRDRRFPEG